MAKYGEAKYGQGKYGADETFVEVVTTGDLQWVIKVGWDGLGNYENEAQYARDFHLTRGTPHYITHSGGGFEPLEPSKLVVLLENIGGRFDPNDTDSALYPNVTTGKRVIISVRDIPNNTVHHLFRGRIDDIRPVGGSELVELTASDFMAWIDSQDVAITDTFGITMSETITQVLSAAGIGRIDIEDETQKMVYFGADRANAAGMLQMLADACLGVIFCDKSGTCKFYNRSMSGMATHALDQSVLLKSIELAQPWDNLRNSITVAANRWVKTSVHTIWTSPGAMTLDASETKTFDVTFNNPSEVVSPEANIDYKVSPVGGDPSETLGANVSVSVSNASSRGCTLTMYNGNSVAVSIVKMRLRGKEYLSSYTAADPRGWLTPWGTAMNQTISTKINYNENDSSSISMYGKRSFVLDNPFLQDANHAEAFADTLLAHFSQPTKSPKIAIEARPDKQFAIDIMDKITLTSSRLNINGTYFVGGMDHKWLAETGQAVLTTLHLHDRVSSTDTIYNEELEILEIPDIPDDPPLPYYDPFLPFDPYDPDDPYNTECLSKFREKPTGPYYLNVSGEMISNTETAIKTGYYPCTLRSSINTYQSYAQVMGELESSTDGGATWKKSYDWSNVTVDFMQGETAILSKTGSSDAGSNSSHSFTAVPASPTPITGVRVTITGSTDTNWSTSGDPTIGALFGDDADGAIMTTEAVVGNTYAVEMTGGPILAGGGYWSYGYSLDYGDGWKGAGGLTWYGFVLPESSFVYYQTIGNFNKVWFVATSATITALFSDTIYPDNTGNYTWYLYGGIAAGAMNRLKLTNIVLRNVCPPY